MTSLNFWTLLVGWPNLAAAAPLLRLSFTPKLVWGPEPSSMPCPLDAPVWSQLPSLLNCASGWVCLKPLTTAGALCDGVLDCWGYHAGMCVAGGERRPNLLLPSCPEDTQASRRRPADIFLPALAGSPAALDFAVTAPQRQETLALAETGAAAATLATRRRIWTRPKPVRTRAWCLCLYGGRGHRHLGQGCGHCFATHCPGCGRACWRGACCHDVRAVRFRACVSSSGSLAPPI